MSSELILVRGGSNENLWRMWLTYPEVTGVNGFLGAHVVDQLVKKGYRVRGYATARIVVLWGLTSWEERFVVQGLRRTKRYTTRFMEPRWISSPSTI